MRLGALAVVGLESMLAHFFTPTVCAGARRQRVRFLCSGGRRSGRLPALRSCVEGDTGKLAHTGVLGVLAHNTGRSIVGVPASRGQTGDPRADRGFTVSAAARTSAPRPAP